MFLAINELLKEKSRFILITLVIVLVSYLVFFLTALAYGLATSYTQGIDKWSADGIITQKDANSNIGRSRLVGLQYENIDAPDKAPLGVGLSVAVYDGQKEDVAIFGIDLGSFLKPELVEGRDIEESEEVIVDSSLREFVSSESKLRLYGDETEYAVVGYMDKATYQTAPLIYMSLSDWRKQAAESSGMTGMRDNTTISAAVVRGEGDSPLGAVKVNDDQLELQSIADFVYTLPGYQAQVLTFGTMIGFLIAIASFVLAIFMYILTLQKKSIFGVLKAEGVPSAYIAGSVVLQTILLSVIGMVVGLILTLISGYFLSGTIPFLVQPWFFVAIFGLFIVCAIIGATASVRAVTKIDPVEAIG